MAIEDDPEWKSIKKNSHKQFISFMLAGKNSTEAYALSFPNASRKTAGQHGHQLKNKYKDILARQAPIPSVALERVASQTLENLTLMAFADVVDMVDEHGKPRALQDIPKPLRMAITEVEIDGERVKYKVGGKAKAIEILARIARLTENDPKIEITMITEEERQSKLREIVINAMRREDSAEDEKE